MAEVEQILTEGDLDLERNKEQLKAIRAGEWTLEQVESYFVNKEKDLESVYLSSKLPYGPDETAVKNLLLECLEEHFGSLKDVIVDVNKERQALLDIRTVLERVGV
jgi:predicted nucleotide-binding protein (sugar kinase/HSP70/actin superfamily)